MDVAEWAPFSHRYGIASFDSIAAWDGMAWRGRHGDDANTYLGDALFQCVCQGTRRRGQCSERASQEDRLCDACRVHCVAVDDDGNYHRLIDVYGPAAQA